MLRESQMCEKTGRICTKLAEKLNISADRAFDLFETSNTCELFYDERSMLYLMSDEYIANNVISELQRR